MIPQRPKPDLNSHVVPKFPSILPVPRVCLPREPNTKEIRSALPESVKAYLEKQSRTEDDFSKEEKEEE